jgi:hypothetical protein
MDKSSRPFHELRSVSRGKPTGEVAQAAIASMAPALKAVPLPA